MKTAWTWIQAALAAVGGAVGWFVGGCDGFMLALVVFVVLDYITGVICAIIDKKLNSEVGFKGIVNKVFIFILVGVANILDTNVICAGSTLRTAVIFFFLSNEGISILENASHAGLPIPQKLKDVLGQLHDGDNNDRYN